jgi:site-specific recombinase XerD
MSNTLDCPTLLRNFLIYHESIRGHSQKTSDEYFLDLRLFFRYLKLSRSGFRFAKTEPDWDSVSIADIDIAFVKAVTLNEVYDFLSFLSRERSTQPNSRRAVPKGLSAAARARKISAIKGFFKYLTNKSHELDENPVRELEPPKLKKTLPHYLSLDQSVGLLDAVKGPFQSRDYCILTLFLNCGLRVSELASLNLSDVRDETLRVLGKGGKERILYLNAACRSALLDYMAERLIPNDENETALFISRNRQRVAVPTVQLLVKKHLLSAGLDTTVYSTHKLRHTAATLMLQNGVDVRTLQEVLGHEHLNTTQIYTHIDNAELRSAADANPLARVKKRQNKT